MGQKTIVPVRAGPVAKGNSPDVAARLNELRTLKDGWLDGKGKAPASRGLDWLAAALQKQFPGDLTRPYLYPTTEGGIQAEWSLPPHELTLEINLASHAGYWHLLDVRSGNDQERQVNLDCDADWQWLAAQIRNLGGGKV